MSAFSATLRYEIKLQLRSIVFWVAILLCLMMFYSESITEVNGIARIYEGTKNGTYVGTEWIYEIVARPLSLEYGPIYADRMGIVMSFVIVFLLAFVFDRDRTHAQRDVVHGRITHSAPYVLGKYIAVMLLILTFIVLTLPVAFLVTASAARAVGSTANLYHFIEPVFRLLLPTLLYAGALGLFLGALMSSGAAAVPIYMLYFVASFVSVNAMPGKGLSIAAFVIRSDGYSQYSPLIATLAHSLLYNRLLYGGLAVVLLWGSTLAYTRFKMGDTVIRGE